MTDDQKLLSQLKRIERKLDILIRLHSTKNLVDHAEGNDAVKELASEFELQRTTALIPEPKEKKAPNPEEPNNGAAPARRQVPKVWLLKATGKNQAIHALQEGLNRIGSGEGDTIKVSSDPEIGCAHIDVILKKDVLSLAVRKPGVFDASNAMYERGARTSLQPGGKFRIGETVFTILYEESGYDLQ